MDAEREKDATPVTLRFGSAEAAHAHFCALHGWRPPVRGGLREALEPLVSCIVLVHGNDAFVQRVTLPSIAATTAGVPIEVLVVSQRALALPPGCRHVRVETAQVARGYNAGAAAARGEYLAFFHDDCAVYADDWVARCLDRVGDGAVGPEVGRFPGQVRFLKCVPLVVRRRRFEDVGRFDERFLGGLEDVEFSLRIAGGKAESQVVAFDYVHHRGMSSALAFVDLRLAPLFGLQALSAGAHALLRQRVADRLLADAPFQLLSARDQLLVYERMAALGLAHKRDVAGLEQTVATSPHRDADPHALYRDLLSRLSTPVAVVPTNA